MQNDSRCDLAAFQDPWNKCLFRCQICDATFPERTVITNHISRKHKMDSKTYQENYGDPAVSCAKV